MDLESAGKKGDCDTHEGPRGMGTHLGVNQGRSLILTVTESGVGQRPSLEIPGTRRDTKDQSRTELSSIERAVPCPPQNPRAPPGGIRRPQLLTRFI